MNVLDDACLLRGLSCGNIGSERISSGDFFGDWEIAVFVAEAFVGFLQVQRNWIVNAGVDFRVGEMLLQAVAIGDADHVEMIDRPRPFGLMRSRRCSELREQAAVFDRSGLALASPLAPDGAA